MARGENDASDSDDGRILSPDELDISNDEHVAELDDGRYVVSPNGPIDVDAPNAASTVDDADDRTGTGPGLESEPDDASADALELDDRVVHEWLDDRFERVDSRYGFDVTAKFDGRVRQRYMVSNDVVTIFESLMLWYAQQIDSTTPVEEVLGILLMESNVPIKYPPATLQTMLDATDLSREDTIGDLIEAVGDDDGLRL